MSGIQWPVTDIKTGERSTSRTNKAIWSAAIGAVDIDAKTKVDKTKNWRYGYAKHVMSSLKISLKNSKTAQALAKAGLKEAQVVFTVAGKECSEVQFAEAVTAAGK